MLFRRALLMVEISGTPALHELMVDGVSTIVAESFNVVAFYDETTDVTDSATWSIVSGGTYATIDTTGCTTIVSGVSAQTIVIQAEYAGLTATKEVNVTYKAGSHSYTETEVTVDASGNTTSNVTTVIENQDGTSSSYSESITYDQTGNPISGQNNTIDVQGNSNTQKVEYNSAGQPVVVEYTIDTSANTGGTGEDLTGEGVNTQYIPFFSPNGFELHIRFRSVASEQPNPPIVPDPDDTSLMYNVFSAKSTAKIGNVWPGFDIRWAANKLQIRHTLSGETSSISTDVTNMHVNNVYDFTFIYNPNASDYKYQVWDNNSSTRIQNVNKYLQNNINLELTLGYAISSQGTPSRYSNVQIYDFSVSNL